ncbi:protein kinase domain-containing protein [Tsukamurella pseudospumae]|uniref:non-specific serine/threonine protein kinase n=1 Tax=Tsukamurella pseudospumae TaxID=239498 RepID=A0A138AEB5_9ACTN|nr:protein kinase [Tsukamurella pseudospumae]KXP08808.1 hypothetical protein AXK60_09090 [Tsukamurella pseudospumae]
MSTATDASALLRARGPLPAELVVDIVTAVANQIDAWTADGLVHGTVQPAEIDVLLDGEILVTTALSGFPSPSEILSPTVLMSNARYLAPEVLNGTLFGPSADTYSLACSAYELLTGSLPFAGGTAAEMMARASGGPAPATDLLGDLDVVLATALAPDPRDRYESAGEFAAAIRRAIGNRRAPG